ncbi:hypothetical protein DV495_004496 [Geotrichum candidum]|nr:hypothetical protein DV454_004685 [Geotrichum candidum]KAF5120625.1 hypothetical protein DV495_004496 [Geotrichum candidum]KAI8133198.1 hypothetical protein DUD61_003130 [Geotrichum candidum]
MASTLNAISSNNVVLENEVIVATIVFDSTTGKITHIIRKDATGSREETESATEWEGFETGTKAAAAGGVTTVIDMPLNAIPPTTTVENFKLKLDAAKDQCWVDVGFWGGIIPGNAGDLVELVNAGVRGFKCFMIESGVDEFPAVEKSDIELALQTLDGKNTIVMFHAEKESEFQHQDHDFPHPTATVSKINECIPDLHPTTYAAFLASRPDKMEVDAIQTIIEVSAVAPTVPLHIVHLASADGIPIIRQAKDSGIKLSVETCFHYLAFAAENIPDKATTFKCCPPIRSSDNNERLWDALRTGEITSVVSDHSPCTPHLKDLDVGDYFRAWGGISSVGLGLSILWTGLQHQLRTKNYRVTFADIARWTSYNTALQTGLVASKGSIAIGKDADFCIFDPNDTLVVDQTLLPFKNKMTPYHGRTLNGLVKETILRGKTIFTTTDGHLPKPTGGLLLEPRAY